MGAVGRRGTPAEGEAVIAETVGVAGKPVEAVGASRTVCCGPALAVAAEDVGRGGEVAGSVGSTDG